MSGRLWIEIDIRVGVASAWLDAIRPNLAGLPSSSLHSEWGLIQWRNCRPFRVASFYSDEVDRSTKP